MNTRSEQALGIDTVLHYLHSGPVMAADLVRLKVLT